jgi:pimeloyl-ACP methyl ester carboxylesterase
MKLFFRKLDEGKPVIILHGLFGLFDNWQTFGKALSEIDYAVYLVDLRNHGNSPHSDKFNYDVLAEDVLELMESEKINQPIVLGHSLGGKTAMQLALNNSEKISAAIIVDMAPRYYVPHHQKIIEALQSVDFEKIKSRGEADKILSEKIPGISTRQFLLKNLYWKEKDKLDWKFNLAAIANNIEEVGKGITSANQFSKPVLFIRGEKSNYILDSDFPEIKKLFPSAEILTAPNAGHWVHADNPQWIFETVKTFLSRL